MSKFTRKIILGISDMHSEFEQGLRNPETEYYDSKEQKTYLRPLNPEESTIWHKVFAPAVKKVKELAGRDEVIVLCGGDITHGIKHPDGLVAGPIQNQFISAKWVFKYLLDNLPTIKKVRIASGTPAHSFGSDASEVLVSLWLSDVYKKKDIRAITQATLDIDGYLVHLAHHGPSPGRRKHTRGNVARGHLYDYMLDIAEEDEIVPNLYMYGHFHTHVEVTQQIRYRRKDWESRLIIMPPLCTYGHWGRQMMRSLQKVEVGIVAIETINGRHMQSHKFTETIRMYGKEKLC